ncbi:MAG: alpha/beta fold hydrolase [Actinobacteria bacterium]|nr:alpha/beta fold hydrolase [Actinomycetota bacterium]
MEPTDVGEVQTVALHGHDRAYVVAGSGPAVLLIHGIGSRHETWLPIMGELAKKYTVIAPDLLGHGQSAKPRADYSIGGYANGLRDLLTYLGIDRVSVVGHSLGGGIAMQFAYQFPQRTDRVVLIGTGGLGPEVNPIIPLCTFPGAGLTLSALAAAPIRRIGVPLLRTLHRTGLPMTADLAELAIVYDDMGTVDARQAFSHVIRAIVDWRGQIVTMKDRAYLTEYIPTMVLWGERDTVIPVAHAQVAREVLAHARVEVLPGAGHFPQAEFPEAVSEALLDFFATTEPARFNATLWDRAMKRANSPIYDTLPDQDEVII